jgi:integrase
MGGYRAAARKKQKTNNLRPLAKTVVPQPKKLDRSGMQTVESLAQVAVGATGLTVRQWGITWFDRRRAEGLRKTGEWMWDVHILRGEPWADLPLRLVTRDIARAWWTRMQDKLSVNPFWFRKQRKLAAGTLNNILALVRRAFQDALDDGLTDTNPFVGFRVHRARRATTAVTSDKVLVVEEQRKALAVLVPVARLFARIAMGTGMRRGEQWSLRLADIDTKSKRPTITIRHGTVKLAKGALELGPCKGGRGRRIPLFGDALVALQTWLKMLPKFAPHNPHALAFPTPEGNPRGQRSFYCIREISKAIGRRFTWHCWRHTCATSLAGGWWGMKPWPIRAISTFLGHSTQATTERYLKILEELSFRSAFDGVPGFPEISQEGETMANQITKHQEGGDGSAECVELSRIDSVSEEEDHADEAGAVETNGAVSDECAASDAAARSVEAGGDAAFSAAAFVPAPSDLRSFGGLPVGGVGELADLQLKPAGCRRRQAGSDNACEFTALHGGRCSWELAIGGENHGNDRDRTEDVGGKKGVVEPFGAMVGGGSASGKTALGPLARVASLADDVALGASVGSAAQSGSHGEEAGSGRVDQRDIEARSGGPLERDALTSQAHVCPVCSEPATMANPQASALQATCTACGWHFTPTEATLRKLEAVTTGVEPTSEDWDIALRWLADASLAPSLSWRESLARLLAGHAATARFEEKETRKAALELRDERDALLKERDALKVEIDAARTVDEEAQSVVMWALGRALRLETELVSLKKKGEQRTSEAWKDGLTLAQQVEQLDGENADLRKDLCEARSALAQRPPEASVYLTPLGKPCSVHRTHPEPDEPCWTCEGQAEFRRQQKVEGEALDPKATRADDYASPDFHQAAVEAIADLGTSPLTPEWLAGELALAWESGEAAGRHVEEKVCGYTWLSLTQGYASCGFPEGHAGSHGVTDPKSPNRGRSLSRVELEPCGARKGDGSTCSIPWSKCDEHRGQWVGQRDALSRKATRTVDERTPVSLFDVTPASSGDHDSPESKREREASHLKAPNGAERWELRNGDVVEVLRGGGAGRLGRVVRCSPITSVGIGAYFVELFATVPRIVGPYPRTDLQLHPTADDASAPKASSPLDAVMVTLKEILEVLNGGKRAEADHGVRGVSLGNAGSDRREGGGRGDASLHGEPVGSARGESGSARGESQAQGTRTSAHVHLGLGGFSSRLDGAGSWDLPVSAVQNREAELVGGVTTSEMAIARTALAALVERGLVSVSLGNRSDVHEALAKFFATHRFATAGSSDLGQRYRALIGLVSDMVNAMSTFVASAQERLDEYAKAQSSR